mmetsp:Transcript_54420/g.143312  ORF Transcript_54420/g.143312 Transcript_54420/m.143312 type:complete len:214 (-) Transcript_54420:9-650(-)
MGAHLSERRPERAKLQWRQVPLRPVPAGRPRGKPGAPHQAARAHASAEDVAAAGLRRRGRHSREGSRPRLQYAGLPLPPSRDLFAVRRDRALHEATTARHGEAGGAAAVPEAEGDGLPPGVGDGAGAPRLPCRDGHHPGQLPLRVQLVRGQEGASGQQSPVPDQTCGQSSSIFSEDCKSSLAAPQHCHGTVTRGRAPGGAPTGPTSAYGQFPY